MQDTGDALAIKRPTTYNNLIYIYRHLYQNFRITANQKSTIDTQRKINSNTTLKIVIKPEEERTREQRKKNNKNKSKAINKMAIRTYISIITLNVNGLNAPTKRHRLAEWIQKQDPYLCCL